MKKYLYSLMIALLASMSFALTSCGDDDDEPNVNNGKVTINYEESAVGTVTVEVIQSDYQQISSNRGNTTYSATLEDDGSYSYLQFTTVDKADEISKGQTLSVHAINFTAGQTSAHYFTDDYSGKVTVADVQGDRITLSFANFKFNRELDNGEEQAITINGNISFTEQ